MLLALVGAAVWFAQREPTAPAPVEPDPPAKPGTVFEAAAQGATELLEQLLEDEPGRAHLLDKSGWTALHHACYGNQTSTAEVLLAKGADANAVAEGECVPIHMAATEGSADLIRALAAGGADLNIPDDMGITALHYAAMPGRLEVVEALLVGGAAVNMKDARHETPLDVAIRLDDAELVALVEKHGGKPGSEVKMHEVLAALPDGPAKSRVPRAWHLEMESAPMQEAVEKARGSLAAFLERLTAAEEPKAAVKFALKGKGVVEYVWGEVLADADDRLEVQITTPPVAVVAPKGPYQVGHDDIVDWQLLLEDGKTAGGYSQRATFLAVKDEFGFLPPDVQAELDAYVDL